MKAFGVALVVLTVVVLAGCSMRQNISILRNGSGTAEIHVELGSLLTRYMTDLVASLGTQAQNPELFDIGKIKSSFAGLKGVTLTGVSAPTHNALDVSFSFTNAGSLFSDLGGTGAPGTDASPLTFTSSGGVATLRFDLSQATWPAVAALPLFRNDPVLASFAPQGAHRYTRAEYLDLLEYAFADYADKAKVQQALAGATVVASVTVQGTIVSQSGGVRHGDSIVYTIPLIDFVTKGHAIDLSVSFR